MLTPSTHKEFLSYGDLKKYMNTNKLFHEILQNHRIPKIQKELEELFETYKDSYDHLKFIWGYIHPHFDDLEQQYINRMVELSEEQHKQDLNRILPFGETVDSILESKNDE